MNFHNKVNIYSETFFICLAKQTELALSYDTENWFQGIEITLYLNFLYINLVTAPKYQYDFKGAFF